MLRGQKALKRRPLPEANEAQPVARSSKATSRKNSPSGGPVAVPAKDIRDLARITKALAAAGPEAQAVYRHAMRTFGSDEKVRHWFLRSNPLFDGESALQVLLSEPGKVEAELVRIDYGVYV